MKTLKIVSNCLFGLVVVILFSLLILTSFSKDKVLPKVGNYSIMEVNGNSMHPVIKNGDLIVICREEKEFYEIRDIVSFVMDDGSITTHEIVDKELVDDEYRYYTKGVNNNYQDNDYINKKQIIGIYKGFRIPLLGYLVGFSKTKIGYFTLVVIPLGIIFIVLANELIKEVKKKRGEE